MPHALVSQLKYHSASHLKAVVDGLLGSGWAPVTLPNGREIPRNGLLLEARTPSEYLKLRVFVYKIGGSNRDQPDERRLQITTTYDKGLTAEPGYQDVVLGYEPSSRIFVGVDPERIHHGGKTGNASTFIDREGLMAASGAAVRIRARMAAVLRTGVEYQAYFRPPRLAEYFFNLKSIHAGSYRHGGAFSGAQPKKPNVLPLIPVDGRSLVVTTSAEPTEAGFSAEALAAIESNDLKKLRKLKISQEQFDRILRRRQENGLLGEKLALEREKKRLTKAGLATLAARVKWVSRDSVSAGYDILSYDDMGRKKLLEVKASEGDSKSFAVSSNEWATAGGAKDKYWIVRVNRVRSSTPRFTDLQNPVALERAGRLKKEPNGWWVSLV